MPRNLVKQLKVDIQRLDAKTIQGSKSLAESFGLTETQLNDPLFFTPTESDYVFVPVRMLSATEVQHKMFNFGHNGGEALRLAAEKGMFNGLRIFKDHNLKIDNWLGVTQDTFWDTTTPGAPPGVTGMMKLDKKSDPKVVRGILSGVLDSVSVTIDFDFEPSHPEMDEFDFYMSLGGVVDGRTVQAWVTGVNRLYELSVVWTGADQYAKVPGNNGEINVPGVSHSQSFKEGLMDPKKLAALLGLDPETATEALEARMKELLAISQEVAQLRALVTEKDAIATSLNGELTAAKTSLEATTAELTEHKAQIESLKPQAEMGQAHFTAQRDEALRLYKLAKGDKAEEAVSTTISNAADLKTVEGFIATFRDEAEKIAPLACTKCGCTSLSRKATKDDGHSTSDANSPLNQFELKRLESTLGHMHRS